MGGGDLAGALVYRGAGGARDRIRAAVALGARQQNPVRETRQGAAGAGCAVCKL
jgi:hypothetical protein